MAVLPKDVQIQIKLREDERNVLCIGGPLNGTMIRARRSEFNVAVPDPGRPCGCRGFRYIVEHLNNGDGLIAFARGEDVPLERVFTLLLEAYAAWHTRDQVQVRRADRLYLPNWEDMAEYGPTHLQPQKVDLEAVVDWDKVEREMAQESSWTALKDGRWTAAIAALQARNIAAVRERRTVDPDAPCDDCKGTRLYLPFTGPAIPCPTCRPAAQVPAS